MTMTQKDRFFGTCGLKIDESLLQSPQKVKGNKLRTTTLVCTWTRSYKKFLR